MLTQPNLSCKLITDKPSKVRSDYSTPPHPPAELVSANLCRVQLRQVWTAKHEAIKHYNRLTCFHGALLPSWDWGKRPLAKLSRLPLADVRMIQHGTGSLFNLLGAQLGAVHMHKAPGSICQATAKQCGGGVCSCPLGKAGHLANLKQDKPCARTATPDSESLATPANPPACNVTLDLGSRNRSHCSSQNCR